MAYKFFYDKIRSGAITTSKAGRNVNKQLAKKLHKSVAKKFKRRKVCAKFKAIFGEQI